MIRTTNFIDEAPAPGGSMPQAARPLLNSGYARDKSDAREGDRIAALGKLFDAGTVQLLAERGVGGGT